MTAKRALLVLLWSLVAFSILSIIHLAVTNW